MRLVLILILIEPPTTGTLINLALNLRMYVRDIERLSERSVRAILSDITSSLNDGLCDMSYVILMTPYLI